MEAIGEKVFAYTKEKVESIRPALNERYLACMENGEEVIISRKYAKHVKKIIKEREQDDQYHE